MNQRIAIPSSEGTLWQHFGKAPQVTIFDVEDGKIVDSKVLQAPEHEHGAMPFAQPIGHSHLRWCPRASCGACDGDVPQRHHRLW